MLKYGKKICTVLFALCMLVSLMTGVLAAENTTQVVAQQLSLGDDLTMNFHVSVAQEHLSDAQVDISACGESTSYTVKEMTANAEGNYVFSVELGAPEMTEDITLTLTSGGEEILNKTYSIQDYAHYLLEGNYTDETKALVKEMLNYGTKAQIYFGHKTNDYANAGYEMETAAVVDAEAPAVNVSGGVSGIRYYGSSMVFRSKIALRYYFVAENGVEGYDFTVEGAQISGPVSKDGMYCIEVSGINPDQMDSEMTVKVTKDGQELSLVYSPMYYITRMYNKASSSQTLKDMLLAAKGYFDAAKTFTGVEAKYEAMIGSTGYTFAEAVAVANASAEDVTITLYKDITVSSSIDFKDVAGNLVIDGNGHTITSAAGNNIHAIIVRKTSGSFTMKNLKLDHQADRLALRVDGGITVNVNDVTINASSNENNDGLIRLLGDTTLNMTGVDIIMTGEAPDDLDTSTADKDEGVIRSEGTKTASINLTDCNIDLTGADNRSGIVIGNKNTAVITLTNTNIATKAHYAIRPNGQALNLTGCTLSSLDDTYNANPIESYVAKYGDTWYSSVSDAVTDASASGEDATITMYGDFTTCYTTKFTGSNNITLDGNGYTYHTYATTEEGQSNHAFVVENTAGTVTVKNLDIDHQAEKLVMRVSTDITVNLEDVNINATNGSNTAGLIRVYGNTELDLTDVDIVMAHEGASAVDTTSAENDEGVIRAEGNKTISIKLTDCNIDLTGASNRTGIVIGDKPTVTMTVVNTTIATKDHYAIRPNGEKLTLTGCKLSSLDEGYNDQPIEGYVAKVGDTWYSSFTDAITAADGATESATIELYANVSSTSTVNFAGANDVTVNGNGYTYCAYSTDTANNHAFTVKKTAGTLTFKSLNFDHDSTRLLLRVDTDVTVNLEDLKIESTNDSNSYGLIRVFGNTTLNLTGVDMTVAHDSAAPVDTSTAELDEGVIRAEGKKTISISLTDCNIDLTGASNRTGIVVGNNTVATVTLVNTAIATKDHYAIRPNEQKLTLTGCTLTSLDETYNACPVEGADAMIGDTWYYTLSEAVAAASASAEDVTITLLDDVKYASTLTFTAGNDTNIVLDGNGHTFTTTGSNHAIVVDKKAGSLTLQNLDVEHQASRLVMRVSTDITVNLDTVNINATSDSNKDGLIRVYGDTVLNLTGVDITVAHDSAAPVDTSTAELDEGVIRGEGKNTISISLTDCNIDLTGASNRTGIVVGNNTTATVTLENTTIATKDHYAIRPNGQKLSLTNCTLSSLDATYNSYPVEGYEALVREAWYYTLEEAVAAANASSEDVTITLCEDAELASTVNFTNSGTNLVLDGNGHTITTTGSNHDFVVDTVDGSVTLQNLTVDHQATRLVLRVDTAATVNLTDVTITAAGDSNKDGLIRLLEDDTLNLTRVNITMTGDAPDALDTSTAEKDEGVTRAEGTHTVSINLTDCNIDLSGASNRSGIVIGDDVTAAIDLSGTTIATKDHYAIRPNGQTLNLTDCTLSSLAEKYDAKPIEGDYVAEYAGSWYSSVTKAVEAADDSSAPATVTMWADFSTCYTTTINGSNDIVIDGNGYTYYTYATDEANNHSFVINKTTGTTTFQNLNLDHQAKKYLFRIDNVAEVNLTDVTIAANTTASDANQSGLIYLNNWNSEQTLNLTRVDIDMEAASTGNTDSGQCYCGAIVTGGNSKSSKKTVNINIVDSNIDVTGASGRAGICVTYGVTANISLTNSTIASNNEYAVLARQKSDGTVKAVVNLTLTDSNLTAQDAAYINADLYDLSAGGLGTVNYNRTFKNRVVLLSDTHYMSDESKEEYEALYPGSIASDAVGNAFGYTQTEKMQAIRDDVSLFMQTNDVSAVLTLGDISTDDYGYRNLAHNFVLKYKNEVMDQFGVAAWALPGNHDSYSNEMWNEMFGYDRQYSVKIGDAAFIMLDNYSDVSTASAAGNDYSGVDIAWLEAELAKYPTEKIFLCSHYIDPAADNGELTQILQENDRIVCAFMGHSHGNEVTTPSFMDSRYLVNVSGYAYKSEQVDGVWQFDRYDDAWAWGFGVLEWDDEYVHYYHVKYARDYTGSNGTFQFAGAIEDEIIIPIQ